MAEAATRTKVEQVKWDKDGLDVGPDIERYAREGWEAIPEDDRDTRLKWYGIFYRKQTTGHFMIRIRIPNGIATVAMLRAIGEISNRFGRGTLDITTRQQVQLRWIRIEDVPAVLDILKGSGLLTLQTGLDNIRGFVGCPVAGLTPNELLDASPVTEAFHARFVGNKQFTNLPRKFNVGISGCLDNCTHSEIQDVAMVPAMRYEDGHQLKGFNVLIGGKMGSGGYSVAQPLDAFVTPEEASDVAAAITLVFRDHGSREQRSKARLHFLLEEWGIERLRGEVEARLGYPLRAAGEDMRGPGSTDHMGVHKQRQKGLYYVGLTVPVGRSDGDHFLELARLIEKYGGGDARFTTNQNIVVTGVPDAMLAAFLEEPLLKDMPYAPSPIARGTVSCTGVDYCSLALVETKGYALETIRAIEATDIDRDVTVNWSGCPAGCGNHQAADIGLMGRKMRLGNEVIETVDIFVGGSSGPGAEPGLRLMENVPCTDAARAIEFLIRTIDFKKTRRRLAERAQEAEATEQEPEAEAV